MVEKNAYWQEGIRRCSHQEIRISSGKCNVCGELAEYFLEKAGASLRENYCSKCGATRATRDLAQIVLGTSRLFLEPLPEPSDAWQGPMPIPDSPGVQALARMAVALCNEVLELRPKKLAGCQRMATST